LHFLHFLHINHTYKMLIKNGGSIELHWIFRLHLFLMSLGLGVVLRCVIRTLPLNSLGLAHEAITTSRLSHNSHLTSHRNNRLMQDKPHSFNS
jgi:hypothetical protein